VALVGVAGLALVTLNGTAPSSLNLAGQTTACDPGAKPANLAFTLKDINGANVNLASLKGKVILLDFWATWCGPCKIEIPGFIELHEKYKAKGLAVVGVSVDDTVEQLKPFVAQYKMTYPVLVGNGQDAMQEAYGPMWGLPTTYLISRDGKLCRKHMGLVTKEQFEKEILGLL
jgi:thiol-disulfide isomerase/thioredoxin